MRVTFQKTVSYKYINTDEVRDPLSILWAYASQINSYVFRKTQPCKDAAEIVEHFKILITCFSAKVSPNAGV
jgi:hypothetical protein